MNRDTQTSGKFACNYGKYTGYACNLILSHKSSSGNLLHCLISGGTKGFILNPGAISCYYITAEYRSACLQQLRYMTDISNSTSHPDLAPTRIRKDEEAVESLVELMEENWTNPLNHNPSELVCLSTGASAPADISEDLLTAQGKGNNEYLVFQEMRIEKQEIPFFDPLPKMNLKTFDNNKKTTRKTSKKEIIIKSDHKLFGHMLLVASSRKLNMRDVLQYPLGPFPWALSDFDGNIRKTNKSALVRKLEGTSSAAETIATPSACILDGMSLLHKMRGDNLTFEQLSDQLLEYVLRASEGSTRVDLVFDVYQPMSIKQTERTLRGSDQGIRFTSIVLGHKIQQWRRLLQCGVSKMNLIAFILEQWQQPQKRQLLGLTTLFITSREKCFRINSDSVSGVTELKTTQEEADTRILLHAKHVPDDYSSIIIAAEDTDIFLLCLAFQNKIDHPLYIRCGSATRLRYTDVRKVVAAIGQDVCDALLGFHAFTGCDTVSSFNGRGKLSALKLLKGSEQFQETFKDLGQNWNLSAEIMQNLEEFHLPLVLCRL